MYKLIWLTAIFSVFFSIQSFGQDSATQSLHPKMDKYYPRPQETQTLDNNSQSYTPTKPVTPGSQAPVITAAPSPENTVVNPAPAVTPTIPTPVEPEIETGPAVTSTPVTVESTNTTINSSNSVSAPATVTVTAPPPKVSPKPASPPPAPYMDTRLGSSSPQYDTWEKNNNGAGSVTTNGK